jgi:hypothetical protein
MIRSLRVDAFARPVTALFGDVLELPDHPVDLVVGHPPDKRRREDTRDVDVVFGFHSGWIAPAALELERRAPKTGRKDDYVPPEAGADANSMRGSIVISLFTLLAT